jgi:hypothetical protein
MLKENKLVVVLVVIAVGIWLWSQVVTFHSAGMAGAIFRANALTGCVTMLYPGGEPQKVCG